jgi:hypothetical protein
LSFSYFLARSVTGRGKEEATLTKKGLALPLGEGKRVRFVAPEV